MPATSMRRRTAAAVHVRVRLDFHVMRGAAIPITVMRVMHVTRGERTEGHSGGGMGVSQTE